MAVNNSFLFKKRPSFTHVHFIVRYILSCLFCKNQLPRSMCLDLLRVTKPSIQKRSSVSVLKIIVPFEMPLRSSIQKELTFVVFELTHCLSDHNNNYSSFSFRNSSLFHKNIIATTLMLKEKPTTVRLSFTRRSKILILKIVRKAENVGFQLKCNLIGRNVI